MRAVYKADTHECGLGAENIGVDLVERVAAVVVVAVTGRTGKQIVGYTVLANAASTFSVLRSQISSRRSKYGRISRSASRPSARISGEILIYSDIYV